LYQEIESHVQEKYFNRCSSIEQDINRGTPTGKSPVCPPSGRFLQDMMTILFRIQYQSSSGKNMTNKTDVKGQSFHFKSIKTTPSNEFSAY